MSSRTALLVPSAVRFARQARPAIVLRARLAAVYEVARHAPIVPVRVHAGLHGRALDGRGAGIARACRGGNAEVLYLSEAVRRGAPRGDEKQNPDTRSHAGMVRVRPTARKRARAFRGRTS